MPDDIPLFPDETNVRTFGEFINLQKELIDHLKDEKFLYDKIGKINMDIQKRVQQRRVSEYNMMKDVQKHMLLVNNLSQELLTSDKDMAKAINQQIEALQQQIKYKQSLIKMSREASSIEIEMAKRTHDEYTQWAAFALEQAKTLFRARVEEFQMVHNIGGKLVEMGVQEEILANTIASVLTILRSTYELFLKIDTAAWKFREAMGMTRPEAAAIRASAERMYIDFLHVGVTIEGAYKSFQALGKVFGGVHNVSNDVAENVALMAAQFGVAEETSAGFLRNISALSKNSIESQQSMMGFAQAMSSTAGVPLAEVMKDVSTHSDRVLTMMSRLPNIALKSAIELRRMGTNLDSAAKSSRHMLDFTENVNEEMNASVLLGRSINLQRARELSYRRDLEESQKEILRITKSINFEKLDVFQQEAYANATGKSVDELLNMLQTSRQIEHVRRNGTDAQKQELKNYEDMHKANIAAAKALGENVDATMRTKANQERLTAVSAKWAQVLAKAEAFLLPIVDKLLEAVLPAMDIAGAIFKWGTLLFLPFKMLADIGGMIEKVSIFLGEWAEKLKIVTGIFLKIGLFGEKLAVPWNRIVSLVTMVGSKLGWAGTFLGKFVGYFAKILGPIGWVIMAFQAITGAIAGWKSTEGGFWKKTLGAIMGALRSIIPGFDWIVKGVKWLWGWLVKGWNVLKEWLNPVKWVVAYFKFVANTIIRIVGLIDKVKNAWAGVKKFFGGGVEANVKAAYVPAVKVTPQGTKIETMDKSKAAGDKSKKDEGNPMSDETGKKMVELLEKIHAKDTNVKMDSQLVSVHLARSTEFRGGYGVNKVS